MRFPIGKVSGETTRNRPQLQAPRVGHVVPRRCKPSSAPMGNPRHGPATTRCASPEPDVPCEDPPVASGRPGVNLVPCPLSYGAPSGTAPNLGPITGNQPPMSMRITLILYLLLLALVALNAVYVLGWPPWTAAVPIAAAAGALAAVRAAAPGRPPALLACFQVLGTLGLIAAAGTLAAPAWQVIDAGTSVSGAGRMAPMFVAALTLYGANLWLDAALSGAGDAELERIARLLSGPRLLPAFIAALLLCAGFVLALEWLARSAEEARVVTHRFLQRGIIPPITVLLFFWGVLLLLGKRWNGWYLRRALRRWRNGESSGATAPIVASLEALATGTARVEESLALLWRRYEESYLLPRYISWAVPILGLHRHRARHLARGRRHPPDHRFRRRDFRPLRRFERRHRSAGNRLRHHPHRAVAECGADAPALAGANATRNASWPRSSGRCGGRAVSDESLRNAPTALAGTASHRPVFVPTLLRRATRRAVRPGSPGAEGPGIAR